MAILYTKKRFGSPQVSAINPNIEAGLRNRYAEIGTALANAKKQALAIQPKLTTLAKARDAGMPITPQTSVEQAQKFVSQPKTQPTPKTQQPKVSLFDKIRNTLTSILPQKQKPEAFGIPQKSQALTNVEKEIANTEAKYAQTAERWKNEAMGRGLTETYLRGQLGRLERQRSIELTSLRAKQRALQGDLTNAQRLARDAATQAQRDFEDRYRATSLALNEAEKEANRQQKQQIEAMRGQLDAYKQAQNRIYQLMVKYPDAGILPSDSWQTIQRKVKGSSLYQKAIRIPASKTATTTTSTSTKTKRQILSSIKQFAPQYKLNPSGFREKLINNLVNTYGEQYKDYITSNVYNLLPDITTSNKVKQTLSKFEDLARQYKEAHYSKDWFIKQFLTQNKLDKLPTPLKQKVNEIWSGSGKNKRGWWSGIKSKLGL